MITKEELNKKKAKSSSEQLDLVETISSVDLVRKKRRFVIFAIIATIGLSFIFWFYRSLQTVKFSLPSVPDLSLTKVTSTSLDSQIADILGKEAPWWTVSVTTDSQITADTTRLKVSKTSLVKDLLPQGIDVKESVTDQSFDALITVPQKKIYISVKYTGTDPDKFKSTLSKLVPAIYWSTIQSSSN